MAGITEFLKKPKGMAPREYVINALDALADYCGEEDLDLGELYDEMEEARDDDVEEEWEDDDEDEEEEEWEDGDEYSDEDEE